MSGNARFRHAGANAGQGQSRGRGRGHGNAPYSYPSTPSDQSSPLFQRGGFDGPASRGGASITDRGQSATASVASGRGSPNAPSSGVALQPSPTLSSAIPVAQRGDPARDRPVRKTDGVKNVDLPATFYNLDELYRAPTIYAPRPGFNTTGKAVTVNVNAYKVLKAPSAKIYQYDVVIGSGSEKRAVQKKVWDSRTRREATGPSMIYDGNRIAWSLRNDSEIRRMVDLDVEEGKPPRSDSRNSFRLHIKQTRVLDTGILQAFLEKHVQPSQASLEAILFLDHLLREGISNDSQFLTIKRSVFPRQSNDRRDLGGGVEVWRGGYQSIRLAQGNQMIVNVDVANSCFWKPGSLLSSIITKHKIRGPDDIIARLSLGQQGGTNVKNPYHRSLDKDFKGLIVTARYNGNPMAGKEFKVFQFLNENANQKTIEWRDPVTKQPTGESVTISQYFRRKYNVSLQFPDLPLVEMTKKNVHYPLEFLQIVSGTRYSAKLDELQTANMIKFAVSPPSVRLQAINQGKAALNWRGDIFLKNYGLVINDEQMKTQARILPNPTIKFGVGTKPENPGTRGRWDLRGKKFLQPNPTELVSWGIGIFPGRSSPDKSAIDKFALDFSRQYRGHGGSVSTRPPCMVQLPADPGQAVEQLHQKTGDTFNRRPQLLVFLVQDKQSFHYQRIKKSCDCRYGVVSQVLQISQVLKNSPQYHSNVLMKVNAKLGGTTSQAISPPGSGVKVFSVPTMFIGADVSHASPGSMQASMAAMTVSFDRFGGRYAAACQTNGHRVEMISQANVFGMLKPLFQRWQTSVGGNSLPRQIYYMRDGVSESQYPQVMNEEVLHIRALLKDMQGGRPWDGKLTVIIASKRHHIRAFPGPGAADNKGNPLPGCLIERDVTSPDEFDFYLYSHIALQGTSRPVHYTVLLDEASHKPEFIQNMIYEHCYQYMRSTTSVSLHPAVYYAHLASNRARSHEAVPASAGPQTGPGFKQNAPQSSEPSESEVLKLIPMHGSNDIAFAMWYI